MISAILFPLLVVLAFLVAWDASRHAQPGWPWAIAMVFCPFIAGPIYLVVAIRWRREAKSFGDHTAPINPATTLHSGDGPLGLQPRSTIVQAEEGFASPVVFTGIAFRQVFIGPVAFEPFDLFSPVGLPVARLVIGDRTITVTNLDKTGEPEGLQELKWSVRIREIALVQCVSLSMVSRIGLGSHDAAVRIDAGPWKTSLVFVTPDLDSLLLALEDRLGRALVNRHRVRRSRRSRPPASNSTGSASRGRVNPSDSKAD